MNEFGLILGVFVAGGVVLLALAWAIWGGPSDLDEEGVGTRPPGEEEE